MQQFQCPFCGLRDEREFHYEGECGKTRPEPAIDVSDEDWARYLYAQENARGAVAEVWMHLPCREVFELRRDSVTMAVTGSFPLRKDRS